MVETIETTVFTCDFCGRKFEQENYPKRNGQYAVARLAFGLFVKSLDFVKEAVSEEQILSPSVSGVATGHICQNCYESIARKIKFNKQREEGK